ncbi:Protein MAIN-LIKE 1 [Glycine soja]
MNIMVRTRGLGRTLGQVTSRGVGRGDRDDSDDAPQRRRPTASAQRQRVVVTATHAEPVIPAPDVQDDRMEAPAAVEDIVADIRVDTGAKAAEDAHEGFPGGPSDPSVLTLYADHVACSVWTGEDAPELKLSSHGRKVHNTNDRGLLSAFVERWHRETSNFHLQVEELTITLDDVSSLLHLPVIGDLHTFEPLHVDDAVQMLVDLLMSLLGLRQPSVTDRTYACNGYVIYMSADARQVIGQLRLTHIFFTFWVKYVHWGRNTRKLPAALLSPSMLLFFLFLSTIVVSFEAPNSSSFPHQIARKSYFRSLGAYLYLVGPSISGSFMKNGIELFGYCESLERLMGTRWATGDGMLMPGPVEGGYLFCAITRSPPSTTCDGVVPEDMSRGSGDLGDVRWGAIAQNQAWPIPTQPGHSQPVRTCDSTNKRTKVHEARRLVWRLTSYLSWVLYEKYPLGLKIETGRSVASGNRLPIVCNRLHSVICYWFQCAKAVVIRFWALITMATQLIHDRVVMECLEGVWETLEGNERCRFRGTIRLTATSLVHPEQPARTLQQPVEWILPTPTPYRPVEPVPVIEVSSSEEDLDENLEELPPEPAMDAPDLPEDDEDPLSDVDSPEDFMSAFEVDSTEESGPRGTCWIYEHFLSVADSTADQEYDEDSPRACRWIATKKIVKRIRMPAYRERLDRLQIPNVCWIPYGEHREVRDFHVRSCYSGLLRWGPVAIYYRPERVVRQFGYTQTIPAPPIDS